MLVACNLKKGPILVYDKSSLKNDPRAIQVGKFSQTMYMSMSLISVEINNNIFNNSFPHISNFNPVVIIMTFTKCFSFIFFFFYIDQCLSCFHWRFDWLLTVLLGIFATFALGSYSNSSHKNMSSTFLIFLFSDIFKQCMKIDRNTQLYERRNSRDSLSLPS